jgi:two-component system OmpR family sensor kinase/two-component system sensor histidine kinase BaeS
MRRRILARVAVGFLAFMPFVIVVATIAVGVATRIVGGERPLRPFALVALVALVVGGITARRALRRTVEPIAEVMEAADRVAAGDYSARVEPRGTGDARGLARSFNAMTERLATNETRRRDLLADVAHELRTPLSVIRGNLEGMLDGVYPIDGDRLRPILEEAVVMDRLLDDLRTLSTAEAGALRLHRETVDAAGLVEDTVAAFAGKASERGVRLEARTTAVLLEADPVRLGEVLVNLVSNALRHTPSGGSVVLTVLPGGDGGARFEVTDTGSGIPAEELPHVFERFVRSSESGGTGLGLAIAKRLVEAHGGTIEALSGDHGTTIRFSIPR